MVCSSITRDTHPEILESCSKTAGEGRLNQAASYLIGEDNQDEQGDGYGVIPFGNGSRYPCQKDGLDED
jgi:hypothetical protein